MKNRMVRNIPALVALAGCVSLVFGQAKPAPPAQAPTFSARTELVLVPVIVTDHRGHVAGLTKDDFIVQENGVEQKLATFEEVTATANRIKRVSTMGQREFSNLHFTDYAPRRINIVVLDTINTKWSDQVYAKQQLVKFLSSSVTANDLTSLLVLTRGGVRVVHDFTADPNVLVSALHRVKGQVDMMAGENADAVAENAGSDQASAEAADLLSAIDEAERSMAQHIQESAIDATLDGFEAIANAFAGVPGRKALVWISGGFPFRIEKPGDVIASRFQMRFDRFFEKLNHANISMYPIDARGLVYTGLTAADSLTSASGRRMNPTAVLRGRGQQNLATLDTFNSFAEMTGGRAFYNTNDLAHAMERAADDSSSYYVLGYYVKSGEGKPGWRTLKVKVRRGGVQVRARSGYFASVDHETDPEQLRKRDISEALASPFDATAVPLTVRVVGEQPGEQNKKAVLFEIILPPGSVQVDTGDQNHMNFQLVAVARSAASKSAGGADQTVDGHLKPETLERVQRAGFTYRQQLSMPPGEYSVKFVVRDNVSGRVGSVTAPVTVE